EYAATTREGKLDAGGILNLVWSPQFPFTVTQLRLIATLELESEEYGQHVIKILYRPDERAESEVLLERPFDAGGRFHRVGINLEGLLLAQPGLCYFYVLVDDQPVGSVTLVVSDREPRYPNADGVMS
ncbi:MAG TPA: hypothetical protein VGE04_19620, partial [Chloroflexia bacterium]